MRLQISAHINTPRLYKDGSIGLHFTTAQEIADDEVMHFVNAGRREELGWLLWSPNQFQASDIPPLEAPELSRTPSERMKAILFVEWQQKGKVGDFNAYYVQRMDAICERLKAQLD